MCVCVCVCFCVRSGVEAVERLALTLEKASNGIEGEVARVMITGVSCLCCATRPDV